MPGIIVIRLHPVSPVEGKDFTHYLEDLTITAYDLSLNHPSPVKGDLTDENKIGEARYQPANPSQTPIVQHVSLSGLQAVATAVIAVTKQPPDYPEYMQPDIRLDIERNGNQIIDN